MGNEKRRVLSLSLDAVRMADVIELARAAVDSRRRLEIGVVNAAKLVQSRRDPALRKALLQCDLLVADGQSIVWASRLLGQPLPERVAGIDIFVRLLAAADEEKLRVYFLGARPDVLEKLLTTISEGYPNLVVAGSHDGYFRPQGSAEIARDIQSSGADMLFLGMPTPTKEIFISTWGPDLEVPVLHGVGGSFDVVAGVTKRASVLWQRLGLEWLVRLCQEPRRLWRRYLLTNVDFILLVGRELLRRGRSTVRHTAQRLLHDPEAQTGRGSTVAASVTSPATTDESQAEAS